MSEKEDGTKVISRVNVCVSDKKRWFNVWKLVIRKMKVIKEIVWTNNGISSMWNKIQFFGCSSDVDIFADFILILVKKIIWDSDIKRDLKSLKEKKPRRPYVFFSYPTCLDSDSLK